MRDSPTIHAKDPSASLLLTGDVVSALIKMDEFVKLG
jgi:hypothetical protein